MRTSNRPKILQAAAALVERGGVTSVTLESVAAEAGLTKGGLMYHFSTREALLLAIHQHLAQQWEQLMIDAAGKDYADTTADERLAAYARVSVQGANRAELQFMLEANSNPTQSEPWNAVLERWTPPVPATDDSEALEQLIIRLAADGLWMYDSLTDTPLPPALREQIAGRLVAALRGTQSLLPDRIEQH